MGMVGCGVDCKENTIEHMHPMMLQMKANAKDNPTWAEAVNGPDQVDCWEAMQKELETLESKDSWEVIDKQDWMNVLPSTWAFCCKRYPDGTVQNLKACFCVRGDCQKEGVDYFGTFAPVVSWQTVRLMLFLLVVLKLKTK
jgi:hypothetical protein